jgi:hypothetical protein
MSVGTGGKSRSDFWIPPSRYGIFLKSSNTGVKMPLSLVLFVFHVNVGIVVAVVVVVVVVVAGCCCCWLADKLVGNCSCYRQE